MEEKEIIEEEVQDVVIDEEHPLNNNEVHDVEEKEGE